VLQVDAFAKQNDLEIVGYYHANERLTDLELGPVARKIADRIQQRIPQACIFLVSLVLFDGTEDPEPSPHMSVHAWGT
jgi:hypothetical protein